MRSACASRQLHTLQMSALLQTAPRTLCQIMSPDKSAFEHGVTSPFQQQMISKIEKMLCYFHWKKVDISSRNKNYISTFASKLWAAYQDSKSWRRKHQNNRNRRYQGPCRYCSRPLAATVSKKNHIRIRERVPSPSCSRNRAAKRNKESDLNFKIGVSVRALICCKISF